MELDFFRILKLIKKNRNRTRKWNEKFILLIIRIRRINWKLKIKKLYLLLKDLKKWK